MSPRVERPDIDLSMGNAIERIRILESMVPAAGSLRACTGCFDVDPEFADCIDLDFNACTDLDEYSGLGLAASPVPVDNNFPAPLVGPYLCNYGAGFRMQVRINAMFSAGVGLPNVAVWANIVHGTGSPGATGWTKVYTTDSPTPVLIDTGWVNLYTDPTGVGSLGDDWYLWLGYTNTSIIFQGQIGPGAWCWRYIDEGTAAQMTPLPQEAGDILIATGSPLAWTILKPGTAGQKLTMSGGLPAWV